jgi:hypothetical protein
VHFSHHPVEAVSVNKSSLVLGLKFGSMGWNEVRPTRGIPYYSVTTTWNRAVFQNVRALTEIFVSGQDTLVGFANAT